MKQARIDLTTGEVISTRTVAEPRTGANQWVPLVEEAQPTIDPATEYLAVEEEVPTAKDRLIRRWLKRTYTAEELAARQAETDASEAERTERNAIRAILTQLRAGSLNSTQVQRVLSRLIVQVMREEAE